MCNRTKFLIVTIMFVAISVYFIISYYIVKLFYHVKHELLLSKNIIVFFFMLWLYRKIYINYAIILIYYMLRVKLY